MLHNGTIKRSHSSASSRFTITSKKNEDNLQKLALENPELALKTTPGVPKPIDYSLDSEYLELIDEEMEVIRGLKMENYEYATKQITLGPRLKPKTLIFDLDETLIGFNSGSNMIEIKLRPYAKSLLNKLRIYFELIVFTASTQEFSDPLLDAIDPQRKIFKKRIYREHCVKLNGHYIKDLRIFKNRDLKDIIIVDNSVISFAFQINNGIPIFPFFGQDGDNELKRIYDVLMILKEEDDIREVNKKLFNLEIKIPTCQ